MKEWESDDESAESTVIDAEKSSHSWSGETVIRLMEMTPIF